jgi:DNA gyrase subunit A
VSQLGRDTQGVKMINVAKGEKLIGIERIEVLEGDEGEDVEAPAEDAGEPAGEE